jgi:hypothetical protein
MWYYLLFIISAITVCADDAVSFKEANKFYQQGAYGEALHLYQKIEHKTPAVFYNMGNAAYHKGDYMYAHLYWLRAQKHGNFRIFKASGRNIALLAKQGFIQEQSPLFLWCWSFTKAAPLFLWQLIFLIIWSWLSVMIWKGVISWRDLLISVLSLTLLTSILLVSYSAAETEAMIINDTIVYNGPHTSLYQIGTLAKGKIVTVTKAKQDWINIIADGNVGWVSQEYVEQI